MEYIEVNFDGLVGQTHNYAGLAFGNVASIINAKSISNPKEAALQGLEKMHLLSSLGIPQAVLPPHPRPNIKLLKNLGFSGSIKQILHKASEENPHILAACYSASSMWTANAATISPASNTGDKKTHITPANLATNLHRSQESDFSYKILKQIFNDGEYFKVHKPLPSVNAFADEGAANHSYICNEYQGDGLELFVYGRSEFNKESLQVKKYPARQTLEASMAIARLHNLDSNNYLLLQQHPKAIDAGAFHNDVVCVGNKNVLLFHEYAFADSAKLKDKVSKKFEKFYLLEIKNSDLSLDEAVKTYLFNSQIVSLPSGKMQIIAPTETRDNYRAKTVIDNIISQENPIQSVSYVDCKQSMRNGGGPACLRLRVIMPKQAIKKLGGQVILTDVLYKKLKNWIKKHYREELSAANLLDDKLYYEVGFAMQELQSILSLKLQ